MDLNAIEKGKVYRLSTGGLFQAFSRHENPDEPENNHWLMNRITEGNEWEGRSDILIFDWDDYVLYEATEEDYSKYIDLYDKELDNLFEQVSDIQYTKMRLEDLRDSLD